MRHPWLGDSQCEAASAYGRELSRRQEREATALADLTGWDLAGIRAQLGVPAPVGDEPWWRSIWPGGH
jgi:hypothetical protein